MGRGDRRAVPDRLGRVFVGEFGRRAEVGAVDGGHGAADAVAGDEARGGEVGDQLGVGAASAAPGHVGGLVTQCGCCVGGFGFWDMEGGWLASEVVVRAVGEVQWMGEVG